MSMKARPARAFWIERAEAGASAMLVEHRLAGLSALVFDYAVGGAHLWQRIAVSLSSRVRRRQLTGWA
jgi:hypothetical protein